MYRDVRNPKTWSSSPTLEMVRALNQSLGRVTPRGGAIGASIAPTLAPRTTDPIPWTRPWIDRQFESPRVLVPSRVVALTRSVRSTFGPDYPSLVRIGAAVTPDDRSLRILFVDAATSLGRDGVTAQTLRSVTIDSLGGRDVSHEAPVTVEPSGGWGRPVHFIGFETAEFTSARGKRPMMLGVAQSVNNGADVDYFLVDHTPRPIVRPIRGVPRTAANLAFSRRGVAFDNGWVRRVRPGLAVARRGLEERLFMSILVAGTAAADVSIAIGDLSFDAGGDVLFTELGRTRVPPADATDNLDRPSVYESVPIAWHRGIERLIVMSTVGQWEGRFQCARWDGTFVSEDPTIWFGPTGEDTHSGNLLAVHPYTGHVYFQTAHNNVTAEVGPDQRLTNVWADVFPSIGTDHPVESWPLESKGTIARFGRWCGAPSTFHDLEFQRCAASNGAYNSPLQPSFVSRRLPPPEFVWQTISRGNLGAPPGAIGGGGGTETGTGIHRIVPTGGGASAYVVVSASGSACFLSVGLVEEGSWPGLD